MISWHASRGEPEVFRVRPAFHALKKENHEYYDRNYNYKYTSSESSTGGVNEVRKDGWP